MARVELPEKDDIPSNNEKDKRKRKKVVAEAAVGESKKYDVVKKEKGFVEEGVGEVKDFVVNSVVMPTVKEMVYNVFAGIFDIIKDSIEAKIFGIDEVRSSHTDYRGKSARRGRRDWREDERSSLDYYERRTTRFSRRRPPSDVMSYDGIVFRDMYEAQQCREDMYDIYEDRGGYLKVADFKKLIGYDERDISYVDDEWGWFSLANVMVKPARGGGFVIDMPKPRPLSDY